MINGLNKACKEHHYEMRQKGFWESEDMVMDLEDADRITSEEELKLHNELLTARIALIITELSEAIEALRKNKNGYEQKDTLEDELADAMLRFMDLVGGLDLDLERQLKWKSEYNRKRGYKHGKLF